MIDADDAAESNDPEDGRDDGWSHDRAEAERDDPRDIERVDADGTTIDTQQSTEDHANWIEEFATLVEPFANCVDGSKRSVTDAFEDPGLV